MADTGRTNVDARTIIADRIAPRTFTREARRRHDKPKSRQLEQYRKQIMARLREASPTDEIADEATNKFRNLAENLQHTKAVAIVIVGQAISDKDGYGLQDTWRSLLNGDTTYGGKFVRCPE